MLRYQVRGMKHYKQRRSPVHGERILLVRDKDNKYDPYAISLWTADEDNQPNEMIGFLPREIVPIIATINDNQGLNVKATFMYSGYVDLEFPYLPV